MDEEEFGNALSVLPIHIIMVALPQELRDSIDVVSIKLLSRSVSSCERCGMIKAVKLKYSKFSKYTDSEVYAMYRFLFDGDFLECTCIEI